MTTPTDGTAGQTPREDLPTRAAKTGELTIRPGTPDDVPRIVELLRISLGEGKIPRQEAYWKWKHVENPFGESPVLLAESAGELAGLRAFMRWNWRVGKDFARSVRAVDTATHPDWQGKGIFTRLTKALLERMTEEGVHFVFNTPNEKSRPGYLKMGWRQVGRMDLWVRPSRPLRLLKTLIRRPAQQDAGSGSERGEASGLGESASDFANSAALASFLRGAAAPDSRLETDRTVDYLRWRYAAIPGFDYGVATDIDAGGGGAVIFRFKSERGLRELRICELLVGGSNSSTTRAASLVRRLHRESGADYISAMAPPESRARSVLIRCGYLPAYRLGPILTVRPLNELPEGRDPFLRDQWRFSIGDLELF